MRTTVTTGFARFDEYRDLVGDKLNAVEHQQRRKYPSHKGKNTLADADSLEII